MGKALIAFVTLPYIEAGMPMCFPGKSPFGYSDEGHYQDEGCDQTVPNMSSPSRGSPSSQSGIERIERYSRKVFVGGLPPDIDEGE